MPDTLLSGQTVYFRPVVFMRLRQDFIGHIFQRMRILTKPVWSLTEGSFQGFRFRWVRSASVKSRPRSRRVPVVLKYPGVSQS